MTDHHPAIVHWSEIEDGKPWMYPGHDEPMARDANYGRHFGFNKLGIHNQRLEPGQRTSFPHAGSAEEEFVHVIEGTPDVWLDGHLHRLAPGNAVGFPAGTGLAHTFMNNTDTDVRLLVVGEKSKPENRVLYPLNAERKPVRDDWWDEAPPRELGLHDGLPDKVRAPAPPDAGRSSHQSSEVRNSASRPDGRPHSWHPSSEKQPRRVFGPVASDRRPACDLWSPSSDF